MAVRSSPIEPAFRYRSNTKVRTSLNQARVPLRRDRSQCRDCGRGGFGRVRSELQVNKLGARCFFPQELPEQPVQRRRRNGHPG